MYNLFAVSVVSDPSDLENPKPSFLLRSPSRKPGVVAGYFRLYIHTNYLNRICQYNQSIHI